jgi:DNA-binding transcriptional LysR family regulator
LDRIDAIKAFIAAVDEGSLSGAARRLHRSPPAITRTIAYLEDGVGVELLHGTPRANTERQVRRRWAMGNEIGLEFIPPFP